MINKVACSNNKSHEMIAIIQQYAVSVMFLIFTASLLTIDTINLLTVAKIIAGCATVIGLYSLAFSLTRHPAISGLALVFVLIALPYAPYLRHMSYLAASAGWFTLFRPGLKIDLGDLKPLLLLFVAIFSANFYSDFWYERDLLENEIHLDTLFHAAIAAMYSNYGITSVGLDGLAPINYHTLSHKIISGIATLGSLEALAGYSYFYFAMGPLLLVFSLSAFACQLNSKLKFTNALVGIALLILIIFSFPVFKLAAVWDGFFVSESYLIALVMLIASLSMLMRWSENGDDGLIPLAVALTLLTLSGFTKGSVGLVGVSTFALLGITRFRSLKYWLMLSIAMILLYFGIIDAASNAKESIPINPLHFVLTYTELPVSIHNPAIAKVAFFLAIHFLPVWVCFSIGFFKSGKAYLTTAEFQVLLALLMAGSFFSLTFEMAGGAAYYFSNIVLVMSLAVLLAQFSHFLGAIKFAHIFVGVIIFAAIVWSDTVLTNNFVRYYAATRVPIAGLPDLVKQLRQIRDTTPEHTLVKIENPARLIKILGCHKAYWFLPAVTERPLASGLLTNGLCPDWVASGFYGLADYRNLEENISSKNFNILNIKIRE